MLELYGLASIIDEHLFGDVNSFRSQYTGAGASLSELRARLRGFCKRTLRNQVTDYIQYTERRAITRPFTPTNEEHALYEAVSTFLQRPESETLFEHFDEDVHERLRLRVADARAQLDRVGKRFWSLTRFMLDGRARFDEAAVDFVEKHSLHGAAIGRVRRTDRWSLPPAAVREAIVNAVVHADYAQRGAPLRLAIFDDRLEVENPGLLPFGLTIEDLPHGISKLRNRVIGRAFHELGLVEMWGSGAQRMIAACRDSGHAGKRLASACV